MSHNYKYLHSVVQGVYKDLEVAKFDAVPNDLIAQVRSYASVFDAQEIGLSESYSYFMIPDSRGTPNMFFTKVARKEKSTSLCHFIQTAGWKFNNVYRLPEGQLLPNDDFDSIFALNFYTEDEIDDYAYGKATPAFGSGSAKTPPYRKISIAPEAIRAILHGTASRWLIGSEPVYIEVPNGVDYNAYVMQAVKQIYSYFPVGFKTNVGFSSYLAPEKVSQFPRVSMIFVPSSRAISTTIRLDGSSTMAYKRMMENSFGARLDAFLEHLAYLSDDAARAEFLKTVLVDAEYSASEEKICDIDPMRYTILGSGLSLLKAQGTAEELFPQWLDFAQNREKYPKGIAHQISKRIAQELTPETFQEVLDGGKAVKAPKNQQELDKTMNQLCQFLADRKDLYGVLWGYAAAVLKKGIMTDEQCFDWMHKNGKALLALTDKASYEGLKAEFAKKILEKIWNQASEKIAKGSANNRAEYRRMAQNTASNAVAAAEKYGDVSAWKQCLLTIAEDKIAGEVSADLAQMKTRRLATADQYKVAIQEGNKLLGQLPQEGSYAKSDAVLANVRAYLQDLSSAYNELMNSVDMLVSSFEGKYFVAIDKYEAKKHTLTENQKQEVERALNMLRPTSFADYCNTYQYQTGKKLDASALIREPSAAGKVIRQDLVRLMSRPLEISLERKTAADIIRELDEYIHVANFLGCESPVMVRAALPNTSDSWGVGGNAVEVPAILLKDIVSLVLEKGSTASNQENLVYSVVSALYDTGSISREHVYAILEMLLRCEYIDSANKWMTKNNHLDGTAIKENFKKQIDAKWREKNKKTLKTKNALLAVLGGLSAVLLAAVIALVIMLISSNKKLDGFEKKLEEIQNQPPETVIVEVTIPQEFVDPTMETEAPDLKILEERSEITEAYESELQ